METKSEELLLRDLEVELGTITGIKPRLDSFDDFFTFIFRMQEKLVIILGEFQNFTKVNPDLYSKFQE
ncbi:ATP-binding protein [Methanolobus profundi]|uniref:hypothetical protein n=1 Tax=Methanolobus profundi TaxID=487685 RepID=UPI0015A51826|nr:hypothetical protein [Methanolobus profundi]